VGETDSTFCSNSAFSSTSAPIIAIHPMMKFSIASILMLLYTTAVNSLSIPDVKALAIREVYALADIYDLEKRRGGGGHSGGDSSGGLSGGKSSGSKSGSSSSSSGSSPKVGPNSFRLDTLRNPWLPSNSSPAHQVISAARRDPEAARNPYTAEDDTTVVAQQSLIPPVDAPLSA
jgi:hypothetical protein